MKKPIKSIFSGKNRTIGVVATAGKADMQQYHTVAGELAAAGIKLKNYLPEAAADTPSYLAASPEQRIEKFNQALNDPEVDLLICLRGGFGSVHLLEYIDYPLWRQRQLPLMGYSDVTSLHCAMLANDIYPAISGSNFISLLQVLDDDLSSTSHSAALTSKDSICEIILPENTLRAVLPDSENTPLCARAYAANLTVLSSLCGSSFMPDFQDMILIIEDVNEPVYKIDRMLCQLQLSGVFKKTAAVVFGSFTGEIDHKELAGLFERIARQLPCPVWKGFPFGHTFPMCAVNAGKYLTIQCDRLQISSTQFCS